MTATSPAMLPIPSDAHPAAGAPAVPRAVVRGLRREAFRLLRSDSRRLSFPPTLRIGRLDAWPAEHSACEAPRVPPPGLARDMVEALLLDHAAPVRPHLWLTRPGDAEPGHLDGLWGRAVAETVGAYGLPTPDLFVVTRTGWSLLGSDAGQRWRRLRLVLPD